MKKLKKITVAVLVIMLFFSPVLAVPAQAQWVDIVQAAKEMGLDTLAWLLINRTIERLSASTVNWINGGFKGNPAYVTDPEAYFLDIGDKVAGQFIFENKNLDFLCGPIGAKIKLALQSNYIRDNNRWQCTLTDVVDNVDDFMGDFSKGGWDGFFELTQKQQNNPIGAYMMAEDEMSQRIANKVNTKLNELNQGQGFMSFKTCAEYGSPKPGTVEIKERTITLPDGTTKVIPGTPGTPAGSPECIREETATPGSVINNKLNEALGTGSKKLEAADEINEIVSALLTQLVSQVIGGVRGLSRPSSSGATSTAGLLLENKSTVGYFDETPDTSALEVIPDPWSPDDPIKVEVSNFPPPTTPPTATTTP